MIKILVVVDMQYDFIDGVLGSPEAVEIVPRVKEKIDNFEIVDSDLGKYLDPDKLESSKIFYTADQHDPEDAMDNHHVEMKMIPEHCIRYTHGSGIEESISDSLRSKGAKLVLKNKFGTSLVADLIRAIYADQLDRRNDIYNEAIYVNGERLEIEICGLCTDICVLSNAIILRSIFPEATIRVNANLTAGSTPEAKEAALKIMENNLIIIDR